MQVRVLTIFFFILYIYDDDKSMHDVAQFNVYIVTKQIRIKNFKKIVQSINHSFWYVWTDILDVCEKAFPLHNSAKSAETDMKNDFW